MSGTQLVIMAVAMGLMYWIARGMIGGYFAFFFIASPIVVGVVAGLIYGDLTKGLIIGGGIAAAFAGIIAPGGNLPTDSALPRQPLYRLHWQRVLLQSRRLHLLFRWGFWDPLSPTCVK